MLNKRNVDISRKPKAYAWLQKNQSIVGFYLQVIDELRSIFVGKDEGFVDFAPLEYRFNNSSTGGYTYVRIKRYGVVEFEVQLKNSSYIKKQVKNIDEFSSFKDFMRDERIANFLFSSEALEHHFLVELEKSKQMDSKTRAEASARYPSTPRKFETTIYTFRRNPHIVAERLIIADGKCDVCGLDAPFVRDKDDTPYLEVHHKVHLAKGGRDVLDNTVALCPNCHRQEHFGKKRIFI